MAVDLADLLNPPRLWSRDDVLTTACVPRSAGVYASYFRDVPPLVPTKGCALRDQLTLLYADIAPKAPPTNGRPASERTLWHRGGKRRTFADGEAKLSAWMGETPPSAGSRPASRGFSKRK